ncbi:probable serine/threonine-protein kinase At1g01540 [Phragmites australis]|uniref:probable serine/threonine-protein kinase At1g01540 n=1 Tax=Phragmites australis TaxID=29695 RepID=UPI002D77C5EB|nr:probable serine/threonine-protein kinase At1g01540 [Phragmites australis]
MNFTLSLIETITNNFSDQQKVGSGGYGDVYRGEYNGKEIAVKMLHPLQGLDDKEFHNEFRNLAKIEHQNIVRLIGYCYESRHKYVEHQGQEIFGKTLVRVLCFEYMHGGSLEKHIGDESCVLDWPICYRIIKGTCEGLNHLHNAQKNPIFHLDLKPANILLDKHMTAKIADLGSSRLVASMETHKTGTVNGTQKYMPPEYVNDGYMSNKFDVFSLGVIIIDIMAGNSGYSRRSEMSPKQFVELVSENWKGRLQATSRYLSHEIDTLQVKTCVELALRCLEADRNKRPCIKDIVHELEELEAKIEKKSLTSDQSKDLCGQKFLFLRNEDGPAHQSIERREERPAGKEMAENCFGEVVDNYKLDEVARYMWKPKTQEDRARQAWYLMNDDDKKGKASRYVDVLKALYGNGQSTLCLVYNATGDTLYYVANHDWYGYIGSKVGYPAEIGNGQWAAFHHVHRLGEPSGSVGAVVYRGKKKDGQDQDYMLAWSTPWGFYYRNKAYGEIGGVDHFQRRWDEIYVKLTNSGYSSNTKSGGCEIEAQIDKGDSPKFTATIKTEHGP